MARAAALRLTPPLRAAALGAALVAAVLAAGCDAAEESADAPSAAAPAGPVSVPVELGGERLHLELAADPETRYRGLSNREHLPEDSGMLFAFPEEAPRAFVMRHCRVPLDLAFLDAEGRVVSVHAMAVEPSQDPGENLRAYEARLPRYGSGGPAQFALELPSGTLAALDVEPGDRAAFDRAAVLERTH